MNITDLESIGNSKFVVYRVKFTILFSLQISAIMVSILIFIYSVKHRASVRAPPNHGLLILLIVNFVQLVFDIPFSLSFYIHGYVSPPIPSYCMGWTFFEYIIYAASEYLLAIISLQRHMFIFYPNALRKRWVRNMLHHLPLVLCIIYPTIFYTYAILLYPCDNTQWDYTSRVCGFANCYLMYGNILGTFDLVVNNSMPVLIDITSNIVLITRVLIQRRRAQRSMRWRQQRHMLIQLLSVSSLYLVGWAPFLMVYIVSVVSDPTFLNYVEQNYFGDLIYIIYVFLPWMWLGFFPELTRWIIRWYRRLRTGNIVGIIEPSSRVRTVQVKSVSRPIQASHI